MRHALLFCFGTLAAFGSLAAQSDLDWPRYRGGRGDGLAPSQPLLRAWPEDGPPELWRRPLGSGFSTIAAVGDRLFTMAASETEEEALCLDAATGETVWRVALGKRFNEQFGDGPRSTPTVDGDLVFAVSSTLQLAAIARDDGTVRWRKDLKAEYGAQQPRFGFSPSVVVVAGRAVLEIGGEEGKAVYAFERDTGEVAWTALDGPASASTPLVAEIDGVPQLIFSRRPVMSGLSFDGEELWSFRGAPDVIVMAQFVPPRFVLTSSAQMGQGGVLLRIDRKDGAFEVEKEWVNRRFRNHFNNSVLVDGHLYGFDNSTLRCLDAAGGGTAWSRRGLGKGSLIASGDRLFVLGDQGDLVCVAAEPDGYRELGRVQALQGRCWTSPSLAAGRLYVRSLEEIVAYDLRPRGAAEGAVAAEQQGVGAEASALDAADLPPLEAILERYAAARGGRERWAAVSTLETKGSFSAFSDTGPFRLQRARDRQYRFEYGMVGSRDGRGRDAEGLWWRYGLFGVNEPARLGDAPYRAQYERESWFEPALLSPEDQGVSVELIGPGRIDSQPTIDLRLTFEDGSEEIWMLHPDTYLEVAVDDRIIDQTQQRDPMIRRTFFSDYREVDGLVLPFRRAMEFGARLEEVTVDEVRVDPDLAAEDLAMPKAIR